MKSPKLAVIGFDGATFDYADPWLKDGSLPNLNHVIENGTSGVLESTKPFTSPVAWSSFATGTGPEGHGIYNWFKMDYSTGQSVPTSANDRSGRTFWSLLNDAHFKCGVVNIPMTYPPENINGFMVSGFDAPKFGRSAANFITPVSLVDKMTEDSEEYKMVPEQKYWNSIDGWSDIELSRTASSIYFQEQIPVDCFSINLIITDKFSHTAQSINELKQAYIAADKCLGKFMKAWGDNTTYIVMSDHGQIRSHLAYNQTEWLRRNNFLKYKDHSGKTNYSSMWKDIDWQQTKAYSLYGENQIYLNLEGREPYGIVKKEEAELILQEIEERLLLLEHPYTGECLIKSITRGADFYGENAVGPRPDIIYEFNDIRIKTTEFHRKNQVLGRPDHIFDGIHKLEGMYAVTGPGIKKGHKLDAHITDIAPTILKAFNLPPYKEMTGKPIDLFNSPVELMTEPTGWSKSQESNSSLTQEENDLVTERLKALGYM